MSMQQFLDVGMSKAQLDTISKKLETWFYVAKSPPSRLTARTSWTSPSRCDHIQPTGDASVSQSCFDGVDSTARDGSQAAVKASKADIDGDMIKPANDDMSYSSPLAEPANFCTCPFGSLWVVVRCNDLNHPFTTIHLAVRVGSLSDPDALPGLAHFTEHMLFYSSEKYPMEHSTPHNDPLPPWVIADEYTKFISDRGGSTNAYTAAEHTNYHFDINWESLGGALDRFAQFFIAPTISRDGIEREVKAVDSEHGKNLQSDAWRKSQVSRATANPAHPWARFSSGNYDTLYTGPLAAGIDPRDAVVDFYNRHYSADRCALAVLGRQSLDELEGMVRAMFSDVPNKQLPRPTFGVDVFLPNQMGVLIRIVPVREGQSLELVWQVQPSERLYREQPLGYLSHLLGHEGEGSVFALLKAAGWASALWAGESGGGMSFTSFFTVHVDLTEEGQRHIQEVAATVFSQQLGVRRYLALLRRPGGVCARIWEEVRGLAQLQFDTRDRSKPLTYCTSLASGLQLYPEKDLLPAVYGVPREFSPSRIREALELLTPERVRALWISKVHNTTNNTTTAAATAAVPRAAAQEGVTAQAAASSPALGPEAAAAAAAAVAAGGEEQQQQQGTSPGRNDGTASGCTEAGDVANNAAPVGRPEEELLTEPVYGTRYGISPLPADWLSAWLAAQPEDEPKLHLPAPNRFIPTDLSLADDEASAGPSEPVVAAAVPGRLRLWHKPDTRFRQPKAVLYLDVMSPEAYGSPRAAVMTRMFTKLMLDYLNEVAYPAQQAGLDYNLINTQSGWQLLLSGYNHKLPELLMEVLERLADFKVLPDRFEFVREGLVREYANQLHNQPYSWAMYRAEMLTTARRWPIELYGGQAAEVTADELQSFVKRLCSRCFVEGLAAGNLRQREALRCAGLLLQCLRDRCGAAPLHPAEVAELRMLEIPPTPPPPPRPQPSASSSSSSGAAAALEAGGEVTADNGTSAAHGVGISGSAAGGSVEGAGSGLSIVAGGGHEVNGGGGGDDDEEDGYPSVGGGWLFAEDVPNGLDENSAALVMYQVGLDDLRRNALRALLVHLAKRDAFSELRTRQQLGYIVSLHGGSEHGMGYVEMLVQSNAYDAQELCRRLDSFMQWFLQTAPAAQQLPECPAGSGSGHREGAGKIEGATAWESSEQQQQQQQVHGGGNTTMDGPGSTPGAPTRTEFEIAVEELAKAKLEKPKKMVVPCTLSAPQFTKLCVVHSVGARYICPSSTCM
ncbi:hypothetical protein VOLCADRAFT_105585 [Volvox carteri f. nagariensis]|uniref:Uncharacterized protein n=1 Tax=Volvox carteri f. nagariensis TaxID=3068 RepID=D8U1N9_VOLCA|nr:uncharacterized protein VOLCADRAFT_105585 [Volvox carteri f. nagariensis]EFJ46374.1 hypothetical protein VOLCADRAFT_105585 [Volvox carteri f. nagariensis]|eukprot:XP_002952527.1 hypothetical protein VOLCADRAFT_105585 [Volvox carteri f. nagariensis]